MGGLENIPGQAPACIQERADRKALSDGIYEALGKEPTKLESGTGIRGVLGHIVDRLESIERKIDKDQGISWSKKIGLIVLLVLLGVGDARWAYQQLKPSSAQAQTRSAAP